jgi:protocatechuate 3,4-dioxygenase beta subunit
VPGCEGCEAAWERDAAALGPAVALAAPGEPGERLVVRGTVYRPDGRTPAGGIVLYVYQTNAAGLYAGGSAESEWSRRHGRLRGWLRTRDDGRYEVRTVKPGRYPARTEPAHIHFTILEPGKDPYWIDDIVFEGEGGVDDAYRRAREDRGGSGIVRLRRTPDGALLAQRDILLRR